MQRRLRILNDTGPELEYLKDSKKKSQDCDENINKKNKFKDEQKLEATTQHKVMRCLKTKCVKNQFLQRNRCVSVE